MKLRFVVLAIGLALVPNVALYTSDFLHSKYAFVRNIELGTAEHALLPALAEHSINCHEVKVKSGGQRCEFFDAWREYRLEFDAQGKLVLKDFRMRDRVTLLGRIWKALGLRVGAID